MSGCKNCGAREKPERCECCGACKHCGKVHAMPPLPATKEFVPYPQPVYVPYVQQPAQPVPWWLGDVTITCGGAVSSGSLTVGEHAIAPLKVGN